MDERDAGDAELLQEATVAREGRQAQQELALGGFVTCFDRADHHFTAAAQLGRPSVGGGRGMFEVWAAIHGESPWRTMPMSATRTSRS